MKIAIVDDRSADRERLAGLAVSYLHKKKLHADILYYADGESFLREFRREKFSIIFLDILMNGMNGMEVAHRVRERDKNCLLIFVTNSNAYALEGYWVKAFHYLMKPYSVQEFIKVMERCCGELDSGSRYIELKEGRILKKVLFRDIWYADMQGHYVQLHTAYGVLKSRLFFDEIENQLQDRQFVKCYRNIIVNMDQVQVLQGMDFILKSGERIPIQKKRYTNVRQVFADYQFEKSKEKTI